MKDAIEWNEEGINLFNQNQFHDAIAAFKHAIYGDEFNAIYYKNLGDTFYEIGKIQETILCYQKAIELDSNNKQILIDYGLILEQQSKWNDAYHIFQRALDCEPLGRLEKNSINHHIAAMLFELREYSRAKELFLQCLKINPFDLYVLIEVGKCCILLKESETARIYFQLALDIGYDEACPYLSFLFLELSKMK